MSGIPGVGQRWQAALKIRVTMIPLPENTVAGAASGVCCSVEGNCWASGSRPDGPAYSGPRRGRENEKPWQMICCAYAQNGIRHGVWGITSGRKGEKITDF